MSILQKGLVLVSIPLAAQVVFLVVLLVSRGDQHAAQQQVLHSNEVIAQAEKCHRLVVATQTHLRGYAITEAAAMAASYRHARQQLPAAFADLKDLVADNPRQRAKADEMIAMTGQFIAWMDEIITLIEAGKRSEVIRRIQALTGADHLRHLQEGIDDFLAEEIRLGETRSRDLHDAMLRQDTALIAGTVLALGSCVILFAAFSRAISARVNVLIDNTRRMAEGKELARPLRGKDELKQIDQMFHQMAETIRLKAEENETFVYSVSHDLRSPLVNLQGFSQELAAVLRDLRGIVLESDLPDPLKERSRKLFDRDAAEAIGFIQAAVTRLAGIIDALLRLSRAGRVEYCWQPVAVCDIVERIVKATHGSLAQKNAGVILLPLPPCWGDPAAVEQIFANLIGNAINYLDPAREGKLEVGCVGSDGDSTFRTYYVRDNGLGIPEALQPKVFVAFQRLHPQQVIGEGMGLTLVRRVVERHGGKIWFESTPGVGTTFFVSLPASASTLITAPSPVTPKSGKVDSQF